MVSSSDTPKQSNYYDDQNFDLDIDQIYTDWISKIDSIRSVNSVIDILNNSNSLKKEDLTCFANMATTETTEQESRCHAFYRLLGLPVLGKSGKFFNPGFDIIINSNRKIKKSAKKAIILDPIKGFKELCIAREQQIIDLNKIFSQVPVSINASVIALSSGATQKLRTFVAPMEHLNNSAPEVDTEIENQTYAVDYFARVGELTVSLFDFKDSSSRKPTENLSYLTKRAHIVAPFIVNGAIDFSVNPQSRLMAVPFVSDEQYLKVNAVDKVERPVLEKIVRDRLATPTIANAGSNIEAINNYVNNFSIIRETELIKFVTQKDIYKQTDANKFIGNINAIRAMINKLVNAENLIRQAQQYYYWVPAPSETGPEGGSSVQKVFFFSSTGEAGQSEEENLLGINFNDIENTQLQTEFDLSILVSSFKTAITDQNSEAATKLEFPVPTTDFGSSTTSGMGDNNSKNGQTLSQNRERVLNKANDELRTIEIIMGEFSGLGLCDIIAVTSALNIIDKSMLLGLLDDDAYQRMLTELKLTDESAPRKDILPSLNELTNLVKSYYNLMDKIYLDTKEHHGIA